MSMLTVTLGLMVVPSVSIKPLSAVAGVEVEEVASVEAAVVGTPVAEATLVVEEDTPVVVGTAGVEEAMVSSPSLCFKPPQCEQ